MNETPQKRWTSPLGIECPGGRMDKTGINVGIGFLATWHPFPPRGSHQRCPRSPCEGNAPFMSTKVTRKESGHFKEKLGLLWDSIELSVKSLKHNITQTTRALHGFSSIRLLYLEAHIMRRELN
jgi:hypothetical protein